MVAPVIAHKLMPSRSFVRIPGSGSSCKTASSVYHDFSRISSLAACDASRYSRLPPALGILQHNFGSNNNNRKIQPRQVRLLSRALYKRLHSEAFGGNEEDTNNGPSQLNPAGRVSTVAILLVMPIESSVSTPTTAIRATTPRTIRVATRSATRATTTATTTVVQQQ